jgi:VirB8 protein
MSHATDDFIRSSGNLAFVNGYLKLMVLVLLMVSLGLTGALVVKILDSRAEHIVPIAMNQMTGDVLPIDYTVVDAANETRLPVEVRKFCEDLIHEAFTFNRFTVKTKLESLAKWASPEALTQLKQAINLPKRSDLLVRNAQGMAEIESLVITDTQPLVRVQVYFQSKALAQTDDILDQGRWLAVLLIKPVKRSQRNPHGLIVMEYRQSQFAATKPEEP